MASYNLFVIDTDTKIKIKYSMYAYTLIPKSFVRLYRYAEKQQDRVLLQFRLKGVELDRSISPDDFYNNRGISIFKDASNAHYSFRTFQSLPSEDMEQVPFLPLWVLELRGTLFVNKTDSEIQIEYDDDIYILNPKSADFVSWFTYDAHRTLLPQITVKGIKLDHNVSLNDLYDNREITIFRGVGNAYSFQTLSDRQLTERLKETKSSVNKFLLRMEVLLKKVKKVGIWLNQCEHLLNKYRKIGGIMLRMVDAIVTMMGAGRIYSGTIGQVYMF